MRKGHSVQWNGFGWSSLIKVSLSSARRVPLGGHVQTPCSQELLLRSLSLRLDLRSPAGGRGERACRAGGRSGYFI